MFDIDHIDPRWEDGRDYQLVCGLDCALNYCERDPSLNKSKNNRFLPWRVASGEIGVAPVEQGDLCLFLVEGEWVLMEFLSEEWFTASTGTCSRSHRKVNVESLQAGLKRWRQSHEEEVADQLKKAQERATLYRENNPDHWKNTKAKAKEWRENNPDKVTEAVRKAIAVQYMCTVTGKVARPGALTNWQRKRGIDTSNRVRL